MTDSGTSFCVLLDSPVTYNGRVQRTVRTLSELGPVLLVTSGGSQEDSELFSTNVEVRTTPPSSPSRLRNLLLLHRRHDHLADVALATGRDFDVVWANDYSTLVPARRIARQAAARLVYDSHELWLETVNQFFPRDAPQPKALAFRVVIGLCRAIGRWVEPRLAAEADLVVTANQSYAERLAKRFRRRDVGVILNCPEMVSVRRSDRIRQELGLGPSESVVLYQGMMNAGRALPELVMSAARFPEGVRLVLLGWGTLEPTLRELARDAGLEDRVSFLGRVPRAELHEWTASADLGVLMLDPINLSKRLSLANKVFEYMAAALPILTTDLPENRRIVDECGCGWLMTNPSPPKIADRVSEILGHPEEMGLRGANGRRCFESRYNWEVESGRLLALVDELVSADRSDRRVKVESGET